MHISIIFNFSLQLFLLILASQQTLCEEPSLCPLYDLALKGNSPSRYPLHVFIPQSFRFFPEYKDHSTPLPVWRIQQDGTRIASNCTFLSTPDLTNRLSARLACADECRSTHGCTHFVWNGYDNGTCWMKEKYVSQYDASPVIVSAGEESLCGIIKEIKADSHI